MYRKIFALHLKSCPMTFCMSIIHKKKYLSRLQQKIKVRVCSASVLYFLFWPLFLTVFVKGLVTTSFFPTVCSRRFKIDRITVGSQENFFIKKCIIPSKCFTGEDVTATKEFLRSSCGVLLRFLYLAIDCALPKYLRTAHGVLRGFFYPMSTVCPARCFFF